MSPQTETKASVGFKAGGLDRYKGRCYHIEPVPGEETQFIAYVALSGYDFFNFVNF
jgi:ribulose 1,5-bisphosphate carboxylase large subunit-like protein